MIGHQGVIDPLCNLPKNLHHDMSILRSIPIMEYLLGQVEPPKSTLRNKDPIAFWLGP